MSRVFYQVKRYTYALRLHGWFFWRKHKRHEPFSWFLAQYDKRQENFEGMPDEERERRVRESRQR